MHKIPKNFFFKYQSQIYTVQPSKIPRYCLNQREMLYNCNFIYKKKTQPHLSPLIESKVILIIDAQPIINALFIQRKRPQKEGDDHLDTKERKSILRHRKK